MTIDDVMALKTVYDAQISPDGTQVLYVVSVPEVENDKHNSDVWLVSADGGEPLQLTYGADAETSPRWSPDGQAELNKIPGFVRGKVKRNTEKFARERQITEITAEVLYAAKEAVGA